MGIEEEACQPGVRAAISGAQAIDIMPGVRCLQEVNPHAP